MTAPIHRAPTRAEYVRTLALRLLAELDCETYPADEIREARELVSAAGLKCPRRKMSASGIGANDDSD